MARLLRSIMNVAIIGASTKPERFSYRAQQMLTENGHDTFPVSLSGESVQGREGFKSLEEIPDEIEVHTVTVYLNSRVVETILPDLIACEPERVIFNPGSENASVAAALRDAGIEVVEDCTLVMLSAGRF